MLAHDIKALAYGLAYEGHDFKSKTVASICAAIKQHSSPMFEPTKLLNALRRAHEEQGTPLCITCGELLSRDCIDSYERSGFAGAGMACDACIANLPF